VVRTQSLQPYAERASRVQLCLGKITASDAAVRGCCESPPCLDGPAQLSSVSAESLHQQALCVDSPPSPSVQFSKIVEKRRENRAFGSRARRAISTARSQSTSASCAARVHHGPQRSWRDIAPSCVVWIEVSFGHLEELSEQPSCFHVFPLRCEYYCEIVHRQSRALIFHSQGPEL